jgi:hypothetical protein
MSADSLPPMNEWMHHIEKPFKDDIRAYAEAAIAPYKAEVDKAWDVADQYKQRAEKAEAALAAEREACAKVCEQVADIYIDDSNSATAGPLITECAAEIRARGKVKPALESSVSSAPSASSRRR